MKIKMPALILAEDEVRQCARIDKDSLAAIENAFTWTATGRVSMPPIMHIEVENGGDVDIKSAYVKGLDAFAIKIASGFYENPKIGLPSSSSTMVLINADTGFCKAVFLDNGYLMDLRTGLAGAVSASHLAPGHVKTVGVIGTGTQSRRQLECLELVTKFERVLVAGRKRDKALDYADQMNSRLGVEVAVADSAEALARESQIIVTTTASTRPWLKFEWLNPGTHITAVGSDLPGKQELEPEIIEQADLVACDNWNQCCIGGELQHVYGSNLERSQTSVIELGEITSGMISGRKDENDITVCDLTGMGVQDTAISLVVLEQAEKLNLGLRIAG